MTTPTGDMALIENVHYKKAENGCWIWIRKAKHPWGYGAIKRNGKTLRAHRFSYEIHIGPIPDGIWILHRCDEPSCVNPDHLWAGTHHDNMKDMVAKGRHHGLRGQQLGRTTKLTPNDVLEIRDRRARGDIGPDIAKDYGITKGHVYAIATRRTWAHL